MSIYMYTDNRFLNCLPNPFKLFKKTNRILPGDHSTNPPPPHTLHLKKK